MIILKHTMAMVWRTENPNYIIILKNKAGKDMDFSKFKIAAGEPEKPKKEKPVIRYVVTCDPYLGALLLVRVIDSLDGSEPLRVEIKPEKKDFWLKKIKNEYRPFRYDS